MNFIVLYSTSPTPFPLILGTAIAGNASRRRLPPLTRRGAALCEPAGRYRAPRGRLASLSAAPPSPAAALPRHGWNGATIARRHELLPPR